MTNFLLQFGSFIDEQGRQQSPMLERGATGIPSVIPTPTIEDLKSFKFDNEADQAAMSRMLEQFGLGGPDQLINGARARLERFNLTPDNPGYERELELLQTTESGKVLLGQSRRVAQRYETLTSVDGNINQNCIRVPEGDEPCEACLPLAGLEQPLAEFIANNQMPGDQCLGGDACLCQVYPID